MRPTYSQRPKQTQKVPKKSEGEVKRDQRSQLLMKMMETARTQPSYKILNRIIQVTKQSFIEQTTNDGADDIKGKKDKDGKPVTNLAPERPKGSLISQALGSQEYLLLLQFFTSELPKLLLTLAKVEFKQSKNVDLVKTYGGVSSKNAVLMKSFSANYTRILAEALTD